MKITRQKCTYANKYKAILRPTCGCRVCWDKWNKEKDCEAI